MEQHEQNPSGTERADHAIDELAAHLRELGAETETERTVKRIVPWITSVAFHASLVFLAFVFVFAVRMVRPDEDPLIVVADFDSLNYEPVALLNPNQAEESQETLQDRTPAETLSQTLTDQLRDLEMDPIQFLSDAASQSELAQFAPQAKQGTAKFAGLTGTNARRIAFVVDASGSMITTFWIVVEELQRSIEQLSPQQEFTIVFFQANRAVAVPPEDRMIPATPDEKVRVFKWISDEVIPADRSNPIEAIRHAITLEPNVIFMLSENITGSGQFEIDQDDLLALLDELNPVDPETGLRHTQIKCVQFLYPDPLGTLEKIAAEHGGENGYRFMSKQELGLGGE